MLPLLKSELPISSEEPLDLDNLAGGPGQPMSESWGEKSQHGVSHD